MNKDTETDAYLSLFVTAFSLACSSSLLKSLEGNGGFSDATYEPEGGIDPGILGACPSTCLLLSSSSLSPSLSLLPSPYLLLTPPPAFLCFSFSPSLSAYLYHSFLNTLARGRQFV